MIQRLKEASAYILFPLLIIAGVIYALVTRIATLNGLLRRERADSELKDTLASLGDAKNAADNKEAEFRRADTELANAINEFRAGLPKDPK